MTISNPTVSVVMPAFNHSIEQLSNAIHSILNQTFQNFELIIVDGSSDDRNFDLISSINDSRIKYFKVIGYINCLNYGISQASGKYVARMDSDDISYPTRLEEQVNFLDANPEISLCSCLVDFFGDNVIVDVSSHKYEINIFNFVKRHEFVHPAMMFRKSINVKFENIKPVEDCLLFRELLLRGHKFAIIDKVLMRSFSSKNSIVQRHPNFISYRLSQINIYTLAKYYNYDLSFVDKILKKREFTKPEIVEFLNFVDFLAHKDFKEYDFDVFDITEPYFAYILLRHKQNLFLLGEPLYYKYFLKYYIKRFLKTCLQNIFSVTNEYVSSKKIPENKRKVVKILGLKCKFRCSVRRKS